MAFRLNKKSIGATILAATLVLNLSSVNVLAVDKRSEVLEFSNVLNVSANPTNLLYG
ncbi:hypothetical protein GNF86_24990, partial [Clostridium perfringens]